MTSSPACLEGDERYRSIFEYSAVSLWEEDISRLRSRLNEVKSRRSFSLRTYMARHPEFVQEAVRLIEVTDVNRASLLLFEADRKEQLLGPLDIVLDAVSQTALGDTILAVAEGRTDIEVESSAFTLRGRKLSLIVKTHIPAADSAYPRMLVSLIDVSARREAEERERKSALILQSIVESSPDMILVKDASLRMVLCNEVVSHPLGKEPDEIFGKTDVENGWSVELVRGDPKKGIAGWEVNDRTALSGDTVQVVEETSDSEKGVRHFEMSKFPLRDRDGTIIGVVGVGRDVTERKKAEAELRRAKEFAENLINTANVMVLGLDLEGRVTIFNKAAEEITGYARAEIMNRSWFETVVPQERFPEVREKFEKLAHTGESGGFENPIITKTGEERFTSWNNNQILENGRVTGILSFGIDITDRRGLEAKNKQLAALVDSTDDAVVGLDLDLSVIAWNKGAERLYGYSAEEMIGSTITTLVPPELEDETRTLGQRLMRGEQISHFETTRLRKDGSRVVISLSLSPIRDGEGRIVGTAAVGGDITAQKALREQVNRALRLESLAHLAGGVAHQFNNINSVVLGYLELIRSGPGLQPRLASYAERAAAAVQKASGITARLLDLTEPAGTPSDNVRLEVLARAALQSFQTRIETEKVQLVLGLAETRPVLGSETRWSFVVSSLIGNALDSLQDRIVRIVAVRTGSTNGSVYLEVEDSGCGISEDDLPRIFSPFFSAKGEWAPPSSPQAKLKGVGLSLAICSTTVSEYGGRIEVRSTKGTGSTFRVMMPFSV